jgi:hypothetical protein
MRLMSNLAGGLARQRDDFFSALLIVVPELGPFGIVRALLRRRDQGLIGRADLHVAVDDRGQGLFGREFLIQGFRQHVLADDVAVGDDAGAQIAQHANARQPVGRNVDRIGIDRPHVLHREQAHADHRDKQDRDDRHDLRAD